MQVPFFGGGSRGELKGTPPISTVQQVDPCSSIPALRQDHLFPERLVVFWGESPEMGKLPRETREPRLLENRFQEWITDQEMDGHVP